MIFLCILDTLTCLHIRHIDMFTYTLMDNIILSYTSHFNFYVYTRQWYSFVSHSNQFLSIHSTMIFLRTPAKSFSKYTLDNDIPSYPSQNQFLSIHLTMIFLRIPAKSISTYTLDNDIPSYPRHLNFYGYTRQWYSFVSQFLRMHSTMIFLRIPAKSISTYTLDNYIPSYPRHIDFYVVVSCRSEKCTLPHQCTKLLLSRRYTPIKISSRQLIKAKVDYILQDQLNWRTCTSHCCKEQLFNTLY